MSSVIYMITFNYVLNENTAYSDAFSLVSPAETEAAHRLHSGMDGYTPTPLRDLSCLAEKFGNAKIWVKDESYRFGLNSFKALGGSYAMAWYLCKQLGIPQSDISFAKLMSSECRDTLGTLTFVTATDGNHGRGVAWAAKTLGHNAVVYMPKGSAEERLANIRALGAKAEIKPLNYDGAVRLAGEMADKHGWVLMQDTAWPGYEDIPTRIMQGYTTMAWEAENQLCGDVPTHVFLQAGVGSMAGAVAGYFTARYGENRPKIIIVEPDKADCHYRTAKANDGTLHIVDDDMDSMMAGLCCGEPCTISWEILKTCTDAFISCSDEYSADGMRLLGRPIGTDAFIESGESGAVTAGILHALMTDEHLEPLKQALTLDKNSKVLLISTEGATDRANYNRILSE